MPVRVLIVDDQAPFRDAARLVVEATPGFAVTGTVETGEESLVAVRNLDPDLVLMDINLPGIDGLEATRRIRAEHPAVHVFVCSTYPASDFEQRARDAGGAAYIQKSALDPETLIAAWDATGSG